MTAPTFTSLHTLFLVLAVAPALAIRPMRPSPRTDHPRSHDAVRRLNSGAVHLRARSENPAAGRRFRNAEAVTVPGNGRSRSRRARAVSRDTDVSAARALACIVYHVYMTILLQKIAKNRAPDGAKDDASGALPTTGFWALVLYS